MTVSSKAYIEAQKVLNQAASNATTHFTIQTPAQKAQQTAYNEFIADYVERHGECKATRDEAHEVADWVVSLAKDVVYMCDLHAKASGERDDAISDLVFALIADNGDIDGKDEAKFLAACAIAAALEVAQ